MRRSKLKFPLQKINHSLRKRRKGLLLEQHTNPSSKQSSRFNQTITSRLNRGSPKNSENQMMSTKEKIKKAKKPKNNGIDLNQILLLKLVDPDIDLVR